MVAALENGTVIDHIPPEHLFEVVSMLGLEKSQNSITIGYNLSSEKLGKKGIIKVSGRYFHKEEIDRSITTTTTVSPGMAWNWNRPTSSRISPACRRSTSGWHGRT